MVKAIDWKAVRILTLFLPPVLFTLIISSQFSAEEVFPVPDKTNVDVIYSPGEIVSGLIANQERHLKFLNPIINPEWFLYTTQVINSMKFAVISKTATPPYVEDKISLVLIVNGHQTKIKYGNYETVFDQTRDEILSGLTGYMFVFEENHNQQYASNSYIEFQHSSDQGWAFVKIYLSGLSLLIILISSFIAWGGFIIFTKPLYQFLTRGEQWYHKP